MAATLPEKYTQVDIAELKLIQGYGALSIRDNLLKLLKGRAMQYICIYIGRPFSVKDFPQELEFVADELAASRLSSINSEGLKAEITDISRFDYTEDIYANWMPVLDEWMRNQTGNTNKSFFMM